MESPETQLARFDERLKHLEEANKTRSTREWAMFIAVSAIIVQWIWDRVEDVPRAQEGGTGAITLAWWILSLFS